MPESVSHAIPALREAERLMRCGNFELAVQVLQNVVERGPNLEAICLLASTYLELGEYERARRYASVAIESEPSSAPARAVLARVNVALGRYTSALSDFATVADLLRKQQPAPPDEYSIPAHFALHNIEQLDHIVTIGSEDAQAFPDVSTEELHGLRSQLTEIIDGAKAKVPSVSVHGRNGRLLADLPYVRVSEQKLPRYLNPDIDYSQIQEAFLTGSQKIQVIDDFLSPFALDQVRRFCLESTVWRHSYKFGYVGAFPEHGFASISLFAIAEELQEALGEVLNGCRLSQWWGFAYDAKLPGTDIHADDAYLTLNLWITPDSANLDPSTGGIVIWNEKAPKDWSFDDYNSGGDRVRQFLQNQQAESEAVPYRSNRAVLFEGHLFHQTDGFTFERGFTNRRRNLTFLFQRRMR
jgi:tetratricopeptide (TPR) repeat protein